MEVIQGGKSLKIAGAKIGEAVWVHLTNGRAEKVILSDITRTGIEGFEVDLKSQPLTFYPYNSILKIKKYVEMIQG
jgi:hypothetical protein